MDKILTTSVQQLGWYYCTFLQDLATRTETSSMLMAIPSIVLPLASPEQLLAQGWPSLGYDTFPSRMSLVRDEALILRKSRQSLLGLSFIILLLFSTYANISTFFEYLNTTNFFKFYFQPVFILFVSWQISLHFSSILNFLNEFSNFIFKKIFAGNTAV